MFIKLLLFILLPTSLLLGEVRIAATVNNEIISNVDVKKEAEVLAAFSHVEISEENHQELYGQAIQNLIDEIIFSKKAEDLNIFVSKEEISQHLNSMKEALNLPKYIKEHNLDSDFFVKKIKSRILQEKVIATEVIPYITVNNTEVENFKEQDEKDIMVFELAKDDNYLGLFAETELNPELGQFLEVARVGKISQEYSIKLLDKLTVKKSALRSKFNFIKISSTNEGSIKASQRKITCDSYSQEGVTSKKIIDFTSDNNQSDNAMYKKLVKMSPNDVSNISWEDGGYLLLLLCGVMKNDSTENEIQEQIFRNKLAVQTDAYIKNLRKNSVINKND